MERCRMESTLEVVNNSLYSLIIVIGIVAGEIPTVRDRTVKCCCRAEDVTISKYLTVQRKVHVQYNWYMTSAKAALNM